MNSFKIAWMLFKNNFKLYIFYLSVLIFTTAIYYNFLSINYNPYMSVLNEQYVYAQTASKLCSIILFFTVIYFMSHANNFFYKLRYKEVGIYMLMGIESSKVGWVFAIESIILGVVSVAIGIFVGILFSKLFFMILSKCMILNTQIPFYIPFKAISTLLMIFSIIIFILGFKNYWTIKRSKLIEILNTIKKEQSMPKMRWIRGGLGVLSIVISYVLALNIIKWEINFFKVSIYILILVSIGTYLFFESFLSIILQRCIKNKKLIYKGTRLINFSNTLFRLGSNYRNFAITAILSAASLTALNTALALKYYADYNVLIEAPYSISYINQDEATNNKIKEIINKSSHRITAEHESHFIKSQISYNNGNENIIKECLITSYSELKNSLEITKPKGYEKILKSIKLRDNEILSILHSNLLFSGKNHEGNIYIIGKNDYILKRELKVPFIGDMPNIGKYETYVISDENYNELRKSEEEINLIGINYTNPEGSKSLVIEIASVMNNPHENLNSFVGQYEYKYYLIGAFYFLGLVMAIVFIISTFSTIYFKILSDAVLDRKQYKVLIRIGMSKEEITRCIYKQVGVAFILPALVGIIHSIMAINALEKFMNFRFTASNLMGISIFIIIMFTFYNILSKKYTYMVYEGEEWL